mmetsp:Transcript_9571/g.15706  ORF Transcript_9571/g.15706 Transcript_9571/m.15706 type:complete len:161 (+) Transcript_9571:273-755(+)|eukprot:CAMPEP_0184665278 /NCGR_PEP_ID=MMETSP0308-20130426/56484_1 /TAXON_ID=38269 /ORGANISM="Gloeochaete witrockiana, Strain SAG 46.84" /LENGTH=160 /DNA_ID=CAMNT_0027109171 /DNA_START=208 /DNA_END=690 /DNA_ORIENTATION=+
MASEVPLVSHEVAPVHSDKYLSPVSYEDVKTEKTDVNHAHGLRQLFQLGNDQAFLDEYKCTYELKFGKIAIGKLYIFTSFICFKENGVGHGERRTWKWPISEIENIHAQNVGWIWKTALAFHLKDDSNAKVVLRDFADSMDAALEQMKSLWTAGTVRQGA